MFSKNLSEKLDEFHLLKHPFYIAWNKGELSREIIKDYAEQYYNHVKAFPRYISATHSLCEDISKRKVLLENLREEEDFEKERLIRVKNELEKIDLDSITPLEALNILQKLKSGN